MIVSGNMSDYSSEHVRQTRFISTLIAICGLRVCDLLLLDIHTHLDSESPSPAISTTSHQDGHQGSPPSRSSSLRWPLASSPTHSLVRTSALLFLSPSSPRPISSPESNTFRIKQGRRPQHFDAANVPPNPPSPSISRTDDSFPLELDRSGETLDDRAGRADVDVGRRCDR